MLVTRISSHPALSHLDKSAQQAVPMSDLGASLMSDSVHTMSDSVHTAGFSDEPFGPYNLTPKSLMGPPRCDPRHLRRRLAFMPTH